MKGDIKPIRTQADHTAALKEIEKLWDAKHGTTEADRLEVLTTLVQSYENEHHPMDPPDAIAAIKFRLEQQGLDRKALEPIMGSRGRVSEIMSRKRALSKTMIRRLIDEFDIPASVLVEATTHTNAVHQWRHWDARAVSPALKAAHIYRRASELASKALTDPGALSPKDIKELAVSVLSQSQLPQRRVKHK